MNDVLDEIKKCDVIIKNGQEQFVGLYYCKWTLECPIVIFKYDGVYNYFFSKVLDLMPVPCVEYKLLAKALFENTEEGDYIDEVYLSVVAEIYAIIWTNIKFYYKKDFNENLNNDVLNQLYCQEVKICKRAEKKFMQQVKNKESVQISIDDARDLLCKNIAEFSEEYGMDYKIVHNAENGTYEFYLETIIDEYDFDLWLIVMLSTDKQEIYVGNRGFFKCFNICETDIAVEYIKHMIQTYKGELSKHVKIYCKEFKINLQNYDKAKKLIKTMLEDNYNSNHIQYGIDDSSTICAMVYLTEKSNEEIADKNSENQSTFRKRNGANMYKVCITYNEFLRNPNTFKKLIEKPMPLRKWNFWSRRKKYKQEVFKKISSVEIYY